MLGSAVGGSVQDTLASRSVPARDGAPMLSFQAASRTMTAEKSSELPGGPTLRSGRRGGRRGRVGVQAA